MYKAGSSVLSDSVWAEVANWQGCSFPTAPPHERERPPYKGTRGAVWWSGRSMGHPGASCPGRCPSAPLTPAPHCPFLPSSCLPVSTPFSPSSTSPSPHPLLFLPLLCLLPSPLLLPCPRGRAQRVVKVNLGSSTWSPRNKASPRAQGLSRDLINLHKPSIGGADINRTEATLRGEEALGPGHLAPEVTWPPPGVQWEEDKGEGRRNEAPRVSAVPPPCVLAPSPRAPG